MTPWGNVAIFYEDLGYAKGLVKAGRIEKLAAKKGNFTVRFEATDGPGFTDRPRE